MRKIPSNLLSLLIGLACWQGCASTEVLSSHNLLEGHIMTVVHGCGGFETYRNTLPPNTIGAALYSLDQGTDALEMDLQMTSDGQLIVFHDGRLENRSTCFGCIYDQTWADLANCQYKTRNNSLDGSFSVPRLDSMFAAISRHPNKAQIFLNVKHDSPCDPKSIPGVYAAFAEQLVATIGRYGLSERFFVESIDTSFLNLVHAAAPDIRIIFDDEDFERGMAVVRAQHYLGLAISNEQVTEAQVRQAHQEGYWLGIWGVKVQAATKKAIQKGPEFIMTDDLRMLQAGLKD